MESISIYSDIKNIPIATRFVDLFLKKNNIDYSKKTAIVLDEILSNISKYSYSHNKNVPINIICDYKKNNKTFILQFIDYGIEFNPLNASSVDTTLSLENRCTGGLGIFIVKCIMDEINYKRDVKKNVLTLKKFFS